MSNSLNPPAIIFINSNLSKNVLSQLVKQLYITEVQTAEYFDKKIDGYQDGYMDTLDYLGDGYISDGYYTKRQRGLDHRILVLRNLLDQTNRDQADIVLKYENGLVYVEINKVGPTGKTLGLQNIYLKSLLMG